MANTTKPLAQPVKTEPNPAGNWPYPYSPDED